MQCTRIVNSILKVNTKLEGSHVPISKLMTKLQQLRQCDSGINRHLDQWNRIESPAINPYIYHRFSTRNQFSTRVPRPFNVTPTTVKLLEKNVSVTSGSWIRQQFFRYDTKSTGDQRKS